MAIKVLAAIGYSRKFDHTDTFTLQDMRCPSDPETAFVLILHGIPVCLLPGLKYLQDRKTRLNLSSHVVSVWVSDHKQRQQSSL